MDFYEVFVRSPISGSAAKMLSGSIFEESEISHEDLVFLLGRLQRKRKLLKNRLGIKSNAQKKNLTWKTNKGCRTYRNALQPRAVQEYIRTGQAMKILNDEFARRKVVNSK